MAKINVDDDEELQFESNEDEGLTLESNGDSSDDGIILESNQHEINNCLLLESNGDSSDDGLMLELNHTFSIQGLLESYDDSSDDGLLLEANDKHGGTHGEQAKSETLSQLYQEASVPTVPTSEATVLLPGTMVGLTNI